ncbi:MAG: putative ABC transporter permease [Clostridiales bacterium]|nr:putative ABC transporter permease [Clostridiales bacterium]
MFSYTMTQWLFFFYFYCFFGWCFESAYVSLRSRHLVNRGFMRGPFLPLYGSGAIMMLVVSMPFQHNLFQTYVAGCIGATLLEYITGVVMEALFKVRYWDYSEQKFNFRGYICLSSTLAWGGLTVLMTRILHKPIEQLVLDIPNNILAIIVFILTIYIVADFTLSFKAAIDLRDILVRLEAVKEELDRVQKRLDVIIAMAYEGRGTKRQEREGRADELIAGIEERLLGLKEKIQSGVLVYPENIREELLELWTKYKINLESSKQLKNLIDIYKRRLIKGNPSMVSSKFKRALQDIKDFVNDKLKK